MSQILYYIRHTGSEYLAQKKKAEERERKKREFEALGYSANTSDFESKIEDDFSSVGATENPKGKDQDWGRNVTDKEDLKIIDTLLSSPETEAGIPFNTNVLRIALNYKEEKVAQVLVAKYHVCVDRAMIIRAVKTR